jgi:hypothetical protein
VAKDEPERFGRVERRTQSAKALERIGWREWVSLPHLRIPWIKAKVDTGALTSALHAFDIHVTSQRGRRFVRFSVHPLQRNSVVTIETQAPLHDMRPVRSSSGHETVRPVIVTEVEILGRPWSIELALIARDDMGFRMLLGRRALRGRFLVDPGRSYAGGAPPKRILR